MVTGDITNSLYYKLLGNAVDDLLAAPFRD